MTIITTPQEAIQAIRNYDFSIVSFDVETKALSYDDRWCHGGKYGIKGHPTGLSFYNGKEALYIDTCEWSDKDMELLATALKKYWQGERKGNKKIIIAHNLPFDLACIYKYGLKLWGAQWHDTMTMSHLLDENRVDYKRGGTGHGLKTLAKELLGKTETVRWEVARRDKETFQKYAVNDAVWTWQLYQRFKRQLQQSPRLWKLFTTIESPYQVVLTQMEVCGVEIDLRKVGFLTKKLQSRVFELECEMHDAAGLPYQVKKGEKQKTLLGTDHKMTPDLVCVSAYNFNSSEDLVNVLSRYCGVKLTEKTDKGNIKTDKDTLSALKDKHSFIPLYLEYSKAQKLLTAFFEPLTSMVQRDLRARPNWHNAGTVTGRLSSSNPNAQQLPRPDNDEYGVRECFVAPYGYTMIACDYSGQENCVLAHVSQDPKLRTMLANGYDLHLAVAKDFMNLDIPEECLNKKHPEYNKYKNKFKEERTHAKTITFGLAYGKSAYGFAQDFGITKEEGQKILDDYFERFPGVKRAIERTHEQVNQQGYVTQHFGRKRRFKKISKDGWTGYPSRAYRQSFNFMIQSPSADMIRIASIKTLQLQAKHPEWGLRQVMTVHDENVYIVKDKYVEEACVAIKECFESISEYFSVPFETDVTTGKSYAEAK